MNILYIYHAYCGRRKAYGHILQELGHRVRFHEVPGKLSKDPVSPKLLKDIDFVFCLNGAYADQRYGVIRKNFTDMAKQKGIPLACYSTTLCEVSVKGMVDILKPFDFVFEQMPEVADNYREHDKENASKYHVVTHGFYPEYTYPMDIKRKYDIVFCGHKQVRNPHRRELIEKVLKKYNLVLFGKNLCRKYGQKEREITTLKQTTVMFNKAKININFPFYDSTKGYLRKINAPNDRFFEIPGSGGIQLTSWSKYLETYFEPEKECFYYKSDEEMLDKIKWILKNHDKLNNVRVAARKRAMAEHTYRHKLTKIMDIVQGAT